MKSIWNISCISCLGSCSWFQKSNTGLHKHARKAYESCYAYLALPFLTFGKQIFFLNTKIFQSPDQNVSFVTHGISHNPCTPTFTHTHMKIYKMDEGLIPQISAWNGLDMITAPSLRTRLFLIDKNYKEEGRDWVSKKASPWRLDDVTWAIISPPKAGSVRVKPILTTTVIFLMKHFNE